MIRQNNLGQKFQHKFKIAKEAQDAALAKLSQTLSCLTIEERGFGADSIEFIPERPEGVDDEVDIFYHTCDLK